jgi:hypothetical protein
MPPKTIPTAKNAVAPSHRLKWSPEVVLSLLSLLISLCSVAFTIVQTDIMQTQQKASVWPYLEIHAGIYQNVYSFEVHNKGVGPAVVRSVEYEYKGKTYSKFDEIARLIVNDSTFNYSNMITRPIQKYVFSAGEKVSVFEATGVRHASKLIYNTSDVRIKIRYASIYEDQWEVNDRNEVLELIQK